MDTFTFDFSTTGPEPAHFRFDVLFASEDDAQAAWERLVVSLPAGAISGEVHPKDALRDLVALFGREPAELSDTEAEVLAAAEEELSVGMPAHPYEGMEG